MKKSNLPPLHIALDLEQVLEINPPWLCRGSLQHESSEFGVEMRWLRTGPTHNQYPVQCPKHRPSRTLFHLGSPHRLASTMPRLGPAI